MKTIYFILVTLFFCSTQQMYAEENKEKIPKDEKWEPTDNRDNNAPVLYKDNSHVYIYSEKQLENLHIGITDYRGNAWYEESTTIPSSTYYLIPIESFPQGTYYITIIQGNNFVIGTFIIY